MAFSGGVDNFVCLNGYCILSGPPVGKTAAGRKQCVAAVRAAISRQLFLVDLLFSAVPLFVFIHLAHSLMDPDLDNCRPILPHLENGRVFDASVFAVGVLCRIFEFGDLSCELI